MLLIYKRSNNPDCQDGLTSDCLQVALFILDALNTDCVARVVISGVLYNAEGTLLPGDI